MITWDNSGEILDLLYVRLCKLCLNHTCNSELLVAYQLLDFLKPINNNNNNNNNNTVTSVILVVMSLGFLFCFLFKIHFSTFETVMQLILQITFFLNCEVIYISKFKNLNKRNGSDIYIWLIHCNQEMIYVLFTLFVFVCT